MWRQVLHAVICWLTLSETFGQADKNVKSLIVDNESAESAPRLYRSVPVGVYASRSPYAAYSFQVPAFITAPKASASRIVPVKQQIEAFHQNNGYLRDSYGNQFVDTPQMASYKTAFPQQYVPLQELPAHLAQPLLAASQNKQTAPHYFVGSQYRVPTFQIATNEPRYSFGNFPQSFVYAQDVRNSAPAAQQKQAQGVIIEQKQPVNNKLYTNTQVVEQFKEVKNEPKFQRYEYRPRVEQSGLIGQSPEDKGQIEAAAAKTPVTAIVNGKKTVINIETKPPVPLLDLSLLEPLTFDNPLVPQLQHFLPRIHDAKYHTLPEFNEATKQKKAKTVTKKKPKQKSHHHKQVPVKPVVTVTGTANESPELSYEINTPNHKETYQEKTVSYNKKVESPPETYSYNEKTEAKPVHYSYQNTEQKEPVNYNVVYSSNRKPEQITQVSPHGKIEQPRQLIYKFNADEAIDSNDDDESEGPTSAEDSGSSEVNVEDEPIRHLSHQNSQEIHDEAPRPYAEHHNKQHHDEDRRSGNYHNGQHHHDERYNDHRPNNPNHDNHHHHHNDQHHHNKNSHHDNHHNNNHHSDHHLNSKLHNDRQHINKLHNDRQHNNDDRPEHSEKEYYHRAEEGQHIPNKQYRSQSVEHNQKSNQEYRPEPNEEFHRGPGKDYQHSQKQQYHEVNRDVDHEGNQEYHHKPKQEIKQQRINEDYHHRPNDHSSREEEQHRGREDPTPIRAPVAHVEIISHPQEHEEDIQLLPPQHNAPIKVDPNQHVQPKNPSPAPDPEEEEQSSYNSGAPIIQEQGKRIIIQEESPEELHMHQEQIMAEVIDHEDNNEEDFEKAYKNAAYGFPGFEKKVENIEKDIYDPASYGFSRDNDEFSVEKSPFQQYQAEGDSFPRTTRMKYNKARDDTEQGYLEEYAINKPESSADRYRNKANYYKLYEQYKPEKYYAINENSKNKEKQRERYTAAPSFNFGQTPKPKTNGYFAQYKAEPIKYEYDYSKGTPRDRDNSAHASNPYQRLKSKTLLVEPQFQYGFDPISLPRLLDSELSAMASNHSPESEKPGMRKKIYEENWYIKKTSTAGGKPS